MKNNMSVSVGQLVRVVTIGEAKLLKGGRGLPVNPLTGRVTKEVRYARLEVSGPGRFEEKMKAIGSEPAGSSPWYEWTADAGIVQHKTSGERYMAFLTTGAPVEVEWFVDGRTPSPREMETIERYKGAPKGEPVMLTLKVDNLESMGACE